MAGNGGKSKKPGRNKFTCLAYKNENRREKNKLKKLNRHLKKFPTDTVASAATEVCKKAIKGY